MYTHHKRMLPKREDAYRAEFPNNYYNASSVYSYSPTSTSDCPEHGRSRRRTTLILVTSVVLATLGVLSIAGIAAYLGIISKNISNNASQFEESYLQGNTSEGRMSESSEENGLRREEGFIDVTNSLADTKSGLIPLGDDDLLDVRTRLPEVVDERGSKSSSTKLPEIVHGTKLQKSPASPNPPSQVHISAKPVTVVVQGSSSSSSSSNRGAVLNTANYYNPVDMIPPPTRDSMPNFVTYFTEEPTSTKASTRAPSRHDRNRTRYPPTNSHTLNPSTTTQTSTTEVPKQEKETPPATESSTSTTVSPSKEEIGRYRNTVVKVTNSNGFPGGIRESVVHVTPSDAKVKGHVQGSSTYSPERSEDDNSNQNSFMKRFGLPSVSEGTSADDKGNNKHHLTTHTLQPESDESVKKTTENHKPHFIPIAPIVSSERTIEGNEDLLNNHKMPISFDRVSPQFYDKNPWTPLLDRPNLDKRPRVDVNHTTSSKPQWSSGFVQNEEPLPNHSGHAASSGPHQNYYNYGHTGFAGKKPDHDQALKPGDNVLISHGTGINTTNPHSLQSHDKLRESDVKQERISSTTTTESPAGNAAYVEETTGGFRPVAIPSYTVIIPHIPNSPTNNNSTKINAHIMHEAPEAEDRNLHTSFRFDRIGLLEVEESKEDDGSNNEQAQADKNNGSRPEGEEDYGDNDDLADDNDNNPSPTKIYKLDPDSVDIVPDTFLGNGEMQMDAPIESQNLRKESSASNGKEITGEKLSDQSSTQEDSIPQEPDPVLKSTTDLIMSTLGSLNLIKSPPPSETDSVRASLDDIDILMSDEASSSDSEEADEVGNSTDSPLFPPVRSYVGVNLPLRPKPEIAEVEPTKKVRGSEDPVKLAPLLRPDLDTVSSLQKVLSMMMKFEDEEEPEEEGRDLKDEPSKPVNITKQNVSLVIPNNSNSSNRVEKSYKNKNRQSKIDEQFAPPENLQHVPVPLITSKPIITNTSTKAPAKVTNVTVNDQNSPVYKFVLRKGQSIEDLLKEIFRNYTSAEEEGGPEIMLPHPHHFSSNKGRPHYSGGSLKSLDAVPQMKENSTKGSPSVTFTNVKFSHTKAITSPPTSTPMRHTSEPPELQTVTSIVINDEDDHFECPNNHSFRCVSTGRCLPSYLRCNFIKECSDNSDEIGCTCADFLKANGNGRKLCDGTVDCADFSDEYANCEYCKPGQYICAGSRSCIDKSKICDSVRDCVNGDDENDCVKIGTPTNSSNMELSSTYHRNGQLMVRKKGVWGKLCVETFSSVVSHWEVKDLAKAVCKALTFSDYESVQRISDDTQDGTPYYELFYGVSVNDTEDYQSQSEEKFSSESTPRVGLGFKKTECKSKLVVNVTCQDLQCGTAPKSFTQTARIVGGANSMPGKWPWQAALYKNGEYQCGATLISSRWLLSAGHCFHNAQDDYWVARLGTLRRGATVLSPYEQVVRITHIFLHPQYQNVGFVNDISLLRLEQEVNFTDYIRPVCLPSKESKIRDGRMCTVVGWGQLFEVGRVFPDTLQEVQLPLISTGECRKRTLFLPLYKLTDQMFCAGFDRGGRDACLGDSGGPIACQETDGRWALYGVTSNGYGCARANRPGVYTKVASYLDWIHEKMSLDNALFQRERSKHCHGHRCLLGECLDRRQICNGIVDCVEDNGSDERGPNCTTHLGLSS